MFVNKYLCYKKYKREEKKRKKSNYFDSHGEEAQLMFH